MRILFFLLLMSPLWSFAQQDSIKKVTGVYCELIASEKVVGKGVDISVDYGYFKDYRIKDQTADIFVLSSIVDALNLMSQQGWQFVSVYRSTLSGSDTTRYILRRDLAPQK